MLPPGLAWLEPFLPAIGLFGPVVLWWAVWRYGRWKPWREGVLVAEWRSCVVRGGKVVRVRRRPHAAIVTPGLRPGRRRVVWSPWREAREAFRDSLLAGMVLYALVVARAARLI